MPHTLNRKKRTMNLLHRVTLFVLLVFLPVSHALAELMVYPTRIVFAGNQRAAQLELINNGTESATYRISLVNRRMSETGGFSAIDVPLPGEQFAEDLLRYSPRQVTLAPGAGQAVRIMVRKPANLATGEYRSHMLFAKQPDPKGKTSIESSGAAADSEISIVLTTLVGISIPVIVRHGNPDASVALTHLDLLLPADKAPVLAFVMERSGNQSVYGDLTISFTPHNGSEQVVARANGVAIYTPNPLRRASITLGQLNPSQLTNGALRVTYREQADDGGALLAETVLQLP
jgi:P pilus assembly chaperone PapD